MIKKVIAPVLVITVLFTVLRPFCIQDGNSYLHILSPEEIVIRVSEIQELQEALKYLSEEEMELIRLLFFEEYTVKKTAQYFGCCTKTIRNRKNKVLQKLKDRLETL